MFRFSFAVSSPKKMSRTIVRMVNIQSPFITGLGQYAIDNIKVMQGFASKWRGSNETLYAPFSHVETRNKAEMTWSSLLKIDYITSYVNGYLHRQVFHHQINETGKKNSNIQIRGQIQLRTTVFLLQPYLFTISLSLEMRFRYRYLESVNIDGGFYWVYGSSVSLTNYIYTRYIN